MNEVLVVKNLSKKYGSLQAVKNISFEVKPGEIFALIGPNGAGKSTTIRMISTILSMSDGDAFVDGFSVSEKPDKVREVISYLPEEAGAYKNLSGLNYLKFWAELYTNETKKQEEFIKRAENVCGLGDRLRDKIGTYSKGMTRKILLARTIMVMPKLAILDEPTSGLDVINAMEIRETIKKFSREGMSVLLSSHNMLEIEFLADRIAIIEKGEICEIGAAQEMKEKYKAKNLEEVFKSISQNKQ